MKKVKCPKCNHESVAVSSMKKIGHTKNIIYDGLKSLVNDKIIEKGIKQGYWKVV